MNEPRLGHLIEGDAQRDAIHVAIAPVVASEILPPGCKIAFVEGSQELVCGAREKSIGVVDPFLTEEVKKGQKFWMFLYPNTVTGMRHHWSHPAFDGEPADRARSIEWLKDAAVKLGVDYDTLVCGYSELETGDYINNGEYICDIWYGLEEEFWHHHKIVTGRDVPNKKRGGFTCSC